MPTNDQDARALTYLARRLRTETHGCREWDDAGTYAKIAELIGQNLALTIERVLCHATDPEARTPGSIQRPFTPPKPSEQPKAAADGIRPGEECPKHVAQRAESCVWCVRGVRAWDEVDEPDPPAQTLPPVGEVRPGLAKRLAGLGGGS